MSTDLALLGLMRLVSPALPVGGFAYSQGLEYAVDAGCVNNADDTQQWLSGVVSQGLVRLDVPLLYRLYQSVDDEVVFSDWNHRVFASRESRELRLEEQQMGAALWRLLRDMKETLPEIAKPSWLAAFAVASRLWKLDAKQCCLGYLWNWLENQLTVAAKTVPIGQTQVQRISSEMMPELVAGVREAITLEDWEISGGLPGVVLASMAHETQYSRMFRS